MSAAPPSYVVGLQAEYQNGKINLSWAPQPGENIANYYIYYSFESILGNEGLFDDFLTTPDAQNSFEFTPPIGYDTLYFAVAAVNPTGEEGDLLTEEIMVNVGDGGSGFDDSGFPPFFDDPSIFDDPAEPTVNDDAGMFPDFPSFFGDNDDEFFDDEFFGDNTPEVDDDFPQFPFEDDFFPPTDLPGTENPPLPSFDPTMTLPGEPTPPPPTTTAPPAPVIPPEPPAPTTLALLEAKATSPTEVVLEFSAPITVDPQRAPEAFSIKDAGGKPLALLQMYIEGPRATVTTVTQERGKVYEFIVSDPAYNPDGLPIDPTAYKAFFSGHKDGKAPSAPINTVAPPPATNVGPLQGVRNFKISSQPQGDGLYALALSWDVVGNRSEIANYVFYQTRDGGVTFSEPQMADANISGVNIPNNQPGVLGIAMSILRTDGQSFMAAQESINIGGGAIPAQTQFPGMPPVVTPPPAPPSTAVTPPPTSNPPTPATRPPSSRPTVTDSDNLTGTGPAAGIVIAIGSAAGWMTSRRKRVGKK